MITNDISNSYVIDQGFFRNKELHERITTAATDEHFIVTEDALVEIFKGKEWEHTSNLSFEIISKHKDKVIVTYPVGNLRETEIETNQACHQFVDVKSTEIIRGLLDEINKGVIGEYRKLLKENIQITQKYKKKSVLNHKKNKEIYAYIISQFMDQMGPSLRTDLTKKKRKNEEIYDLINQGIKEIFYNPESIFRKQMSDLDLKTFIKNKPIHYVLYATILFEAFYWQQRLGLSTMNSSKITNYILDSNYVIIAFYTKGILSSDSFVNELYHHLRRIVKSKNI